jgi:hypothetical protein
MHLYIYIYVCVCICVCMFWGAFILRNIHFKQPTKLLMLDVCVFSRCLQSCDHCFELFSILSLQLGDLDDTSFSIQNTHPSGCFGQAPMHRAELLSFSRHASNSFQHSPIIQIRKNKREANLSRLLTTPCCSGSSQGLYTLYFFEKSRQSSTLCPCMLIYSRHRTHHFVSASNG